MNVALTRARFGLIVVGSAKVFSRSKLWSDFIEYCQGLGAFVEGEIGSWRPGTFQREQAPEENSDDGEDLA